MSESIPGMEKLNMWIRNHANNPKVKLLTYEKPVRSVQEAVEVSGIEKSYFIKTVVFKNKDTAEYVATIVPAGTKVNKRAIQEGVGPKRWTFPRNEELLENIGFPAGGIPPVGLPSSLTVYVDPRVLQKDMVVAGGGSTTSLLQLEPNLILESGAVEKIICYG